MTQFEGYRSPRRPEFFLSRDWRPHEIYENFRQYEQDFRDILEDVEIEEDFYIVGERNGRIGFDEFQHLAYAGDIEVAFADMELEAEEVNGRIHYEGHLPGEGAGRIKASFEVKEKNSTRTVTETFQATHYKNFNTGTTNLTLTRKVRQHEATT